MEEKDNIITLLGIPFTVNNMIAATFAVLLTFSIVFFLSRNLRMYPKKRQNFLEWIVEFSNGIVKNSLPDSESKKYGLLAFTLLMYIFISNQLGLFIQLSVNDVTYVKSPTASPVQTFALALLVILLAHAEGVRRFGFKGYVRNSFLSPMKLLLPINFLEQFTNFLTLALRLFGNIYAGEVLLTLIYTSFVGKNIWGLIPAIPIEILWQGFSVFIGSIQAYVFTTLTMVYISQKLEIE